MIGSEIRCISAGSVRALFREWTPPYPGFRRLVSPHDVMEYDSMRCSPAKKILNYMVLIGIQAVADQGSREPHEVMDIRPQEPISSANSCGEWYHTGK